MKAIWIATDAPEIPPETEGLVYADNFEPDTFVFFYSDDADGLYCSRGDFRLATQEAAR